MWLEWVVAQELLRRRAISEKDLFEPMTFWQSIAHEIDFYEDSIGFLEIKRGSAPAQEFHWFLKTFPKDNLHFITNCEYQTTQLRARTLENFLLQKGS